MSNKRFGGRTLARSQALQILFQAEASGRTVTEVLSGEYALSDGPLDPYGEKLARGAGEKIRLLDAIIARASMNWSVARMPAVDRNLLRLTIYEILECDDVDTAVSIDESVELAKAFGTDESPRFVNGVLGRIAAQLSQGEDLVAEAQDELAHAHEAASAADAPDGAADDAADDAFNDPANTSADGFEAYTPSSFEDEEA